MLLSRGGVQIGNSHLGSFIPAYSYPALSLIYSRCDAGGLVLLRFGACENDRQTP